MSSWNLEFEHEFEILNENQFSLKMEPTTYFLCIEVQWKAPIYNDNLVEEHQVLFRFLFRHRFSSYFSRSPQKQFRIEHMGVDSLASLKPSPATLMKHYDMLRSDHSRFWYTNRDVTSRSPSIPAVLITDTGKSCQRWRHLVSFEINIFKVKATNRDVTSRSPSILAVLITDTGKSCQRWRHLVSFGINIFKVKPVKTLLFGRAL